MGGGNSQNLNQRFSLTSHTRKGNLQERPQNSRHSLHLASLARGGDLHRKSVGFKTLTIACLALALISTITLNIIRTYSINNTRTNALDNTTSGIATQSASDGNTLANPLSISIKLSPVTTNTTSNPDNGSAIVSLNIPADGGVAVGGHSVEVTTNSTAGYKVTMSLDNGYDSTNLVNTDLPSQIIPSLPEPTSTALSPLEDKTWGIALLFDSQSDWFSPEEDYLSTDQAVLSKAKFTGADSFTSNIMQGIGLSKQPTGPNHDGTAADNLGNIYYGVRVDDPSTFTAGQYTTSITYTATAILPPAPELTKLILNDSVQQNQTSEFAIEGTNLDTVYDVWIDYNDNGKEDANEKATNVTTYPNTDKASTIISFTNPNPTSNTVSPGAYDVYVVGQGGASQPLTDAFIVQEESTCRNGDPNSDCQVDIDDFMFPIVYDGDSESGWKMVHEQDVLHAQGSWYDYTNKQWANAVTLNNNTGFCSNTRYTPPQGDEIAKIDFSFWRPDDPRYSSYKCDEVGAAAVAAVLYKQVTLSGDDSIDVQEIYSDPEFTQTMTSFELRNDDILGYWVYIPRYAYEVQRPNAIDRVVTDEYPLPDNVNITGDDNSPYNEHSIRNEFSIHFETATDTKKAPAETCNILNPTMEQMWQDGDIESANDGNMYNPLLLAKDYRTDCVNESNGAITRTYGSATGTTWATHPAFSWLDNNGNGEELNGLWIGKFETTGTVTNPTVKPNQHANVNEYLGEFYTMAKHIGVYDPSNTGGNDITANGTTLNATGRWTSLHNLSTATSHMLKNSEWGAITYLASSKYGAGTNNVAANTAVPTVSADADIATPSNKYSYGITGCGPNNANRSTDAYSSVIASTGETLNLPALSSSNIEDPLACGDVDHSYIGNIGQLASTTNNVYGIYDMSGGAYEHVMGNLTSSDTETTPYNTTTMQNQVKPPYVDLYKESSGFDSTGSDDTNPAWSYSANATLYNNDVCTWDTCGGHAIHETKRSQSSSKSYSSWGGTIGHFSDQEYRWLQRGGYSNGGFNTGLFNINVSWGGLYNHYSFHVVLLPLP